MSVLMLVMCLLGFGPNPVTVDDCGDLHAAWATPVSSECTGLDHHGVFDFIRVMNGDCPCEGAVLFPTGSITYPEQILQTPFMVFSPTGETLYMRRNNTLFVFQRNLQNGNLNVLETFDFENGDTDPESLAIRDTFYPEISPDGKFLYLNGRGKYSLWNISPTDGRLSLVQVYDHFTPPTPENPITRKDMLTSNGQFFIFAAHSSEEPHTVNVFARDEETGVLTFLSSTTERQPGVLFEEIKHTEYNKASKRLYIFSRVASDNSVTYITVFEVDEETGALTRMDGMDSDMEGYDWAHQSWRLFFAPDIHYAYIPATVRRLVIARDRSPLYFLRYESEIQYNSGRSVGPSHVVVDPSGTRAFVAFNFVSRIEVFDRNPQDGSLTSNREVCFPITDALLASTNLLVRSPDGKYLYQSCYTDTETYLFWYRVENNE